jgi:tetratricopeptide (TPR) repeat protein
MQPMPMPAPRDPQDAMPKPDPPLAQPPATPLPKDKLGDKPATGAPAEHAKPTPLQGANGLPDLNQLFDRLRAAKSEDEAKLVNLMIEAEFLQSGSDTIDLLMYRALTAVQNQDMSLAMDLLDTVIALKPDYAEGWNKRATLYFMKRDYGKAISDVEMVLRLQPRHYPALIGLAQMLNELGDSKHALEALKRAQLIYPLNSVVTKQVEELQSTLGGRDL